jgi:hypothetical protein
LQSRSREDVSNQDSPAGTSPQQSSDSIGSQSLDDRKADGRYSVYLLYWYKSTNNDAEGADASKLADIHNTEAVTACFQSAKKGNMQKTEAALASGEVTGASA